MRKRTGLIVKKIRNSRIFRDGVHIPVTALHLDECMVVGVKTKEKDGYTALQLGVGTQQASRISKAQAGLFFKKSIPVKQKMAEFRVDEDAILEEGSRIFAGHFVEGQYVDVTGETIGRGFCGVIKRHGFHGLRASHGVSISHRSHGSTGSNQDPGRVFKNKKMAGRHGSTSKTVQNLVVELVDNELGIIYVRGSVPGSSKGYLYIRDSKKKGNVSARDASTRLDLPFPTLVYESGLSDQKSAELGS